MLMELVKDQRLTAKEVMQRRSYVQRQMIVQSPYLHAANFHEICDQDLELLFELIDERFFDNRCLRTVRALNCPLTFRLSGKMTRTGGTTTQRIVFGKNSRGKVDRSRRKSQYEIAISTTLLFGTFRDGDPPREVAGVMCKNRLDALMRVMEHEMIHLAELLLWKESSCSATRFREIAHRFFKHKSSNHQLITPRERAASDFGIRTGDTVSFDFRGNRLTGKVNRITRRATVLVPSTDGEVYSDGGRYLKYYIPIRELRKAK